jgi:hypothetical protein
MSGVNSKGYIKVVKKVMLNTKKLVDRINNCFKSKVKAQSVVAGIEK